MWPMTLIKMVVLRANPQDLPTSTALTLLAVAMYYVADVATALMMAPVTNALQAAAVDTLLLLALTQTALNLRHQGGRLRQTIMALAGAGAIMAGVTVALYSVLPDAILPEVLWMLSALWLFAVYGHVLRQAFDVSYKAGIAATGLYFVVSLLLTAPFLISSQS